MSALTQITEDTRTSYVEEMSSLPSRLLLSWRGTSVLCPRSNQAIDNATEGCRFHLELDMQRATAA